MQKIARNLITAAGNKEPLPDINTRFTSLKQPSCAFCTMRKNDGLRGCICYAVKYLAETVQETAVQSALADPRFYPRGPEELNSIKLEI